MEDSFYEQYWQRRGVSGHRPRHDIFARWIPDGSSVIDVGCGDGAFLEYLKKNKKGIAAVGLDISEEGVRLAQTRGIDAAVGDATKPLPFPDKSFDYAVSSELLEHIPTTEFALREMGRVARRAVLVSIPNIALWKQRARLFFAGRFPKQWVSEPQEHVRFFSVRDFKELARAEGFAVKESVVSSGTRGLKRLWPNLFGDQVCFRLEWK